MEDNEICILNLPDCLTMTLLSYLDASSLYNLSRSCIRFKYLIEDESLWKHIDARSTPYSLEKIDYIFRKISERTESLMIAGDSQYTPIRADSYFHRLHVAKNLTILVLENIQFNGNVITMNNFPSSLEELSLKGSYVINSNYFFKQSLDTMSKLKVMILDFCSWVESSSLMSLSKYPSLEILSLHSCKGIDNSIPYLSLAGSFGFKNLKVFDARLTDLAGALLKSLYKSKTLLAIYLQNEDIQSYLDYLQRSLEFLKNKESCSHFTEHTLDDFNVEDYSDIVNKGRHLQFFNDIGLVEYSRIEGDGASQELPKSRLYEYPYRVCTCGYPEKTAKYKYKPNGVKWTKGKDFKSTAHSSDEDDDGDSDDDSSHGDDDNPKKPNREHTQRRIERHINKLVRARRSMGSPVIIRRDKSSCAFHKLLASLASLNNGCHFITIQAEPLLNRGNARLDQPSTSRENNPQEDRNRDRPSNNNKRTLDNRQDSDETPPTKRLRTGTPPHNSNNNNNNDNGNNDNANAFAANNPNGNEVVMAINAADPRSVSIFYFDNKKQKHLKIPLKHLSLRGFKGITDRSLDYIRNLSIELLDVTGTSVSANGIDKYLTYNPNCRVIHEMYCQCRPKLKF